jgi:anti-sigma regulatory factor (Ser/Thr protein kinase)
MVLVKSSLEDMLQGIGNSTHTEMTITTPKENYNLCNTLLDELWKANRYPFSDTKTKYDFYLVMKEAFDNAIRHGCKEQSNISVSISSYVGDRGLVMQISDSGKGYDIDAAMEKSKSRIKELYENEGQRGGLGLLYYRVMENVQVSLSEKGNTVIIGHFSGNKKP